MKEEIDNKLEEKQERNVRLQQAVAPLCEWYKAGHRILPWRSNPTPYHVWISEIMLQQTRVEAVKPYYARFLEYLPDISALAQVEDDVLMKLWEGLGYYSRARNLKKAAITCCQQYDGNLPNSYEALLQLSGIGSYTAGAIASIAYGLPVAAVDGNVLRVISRLTADETDISLASTKKNMEIELNELIQKLVSEPGVFNQALMELGAMVCIPNGTPLCEKCPWKELCLARQKNKIAQIPYKAPKKARKIEEWTVFVVNDNDMTMIQKRPDTGLLAGLYEFPMQSGHLSKEEAIAWWNERGMAVLLREIKPAKHIFSHIEWHMKGYEVKFLESEVENEMIAESGEHFIFVPKERIRDTYSMPGAFRQFVSYLNK